MESANSSNSQILITLLFSQMDESVFMTHLNIQQFHTNRKFLIINKIENILNLSLIIFDEQFSLSLKQK